MISLKKWVIQLSIAMLRLLKVYQFMPAAILANKDNKQSFLLCFIAQCTVKHPAVGFNVDYSSSSLMTDRYGYSLPHKCCSMLRLSSVDIFKTENLDLKYINLILESTTFIFFHHNYHKETLGF